MENSVLSQRWPWLLALTVVVVGWGVYLSSVYDIEIGDQDDRPIGTAEDIERLAERDDVNVLFIIIDTLRSDRMGSYGYERETSPTFDRLAERGVRFSRHLAQSSWTKCSMASMWTGLNPSRSGVTRFDDKLSEEAQLPAEIMQDAGFQTVGLYRNGWVEGYFGFDQGFDVYTKTNGGGIPASVRFENPTMKNRSTDVSIIPSAVEFARVYGDERWFLYVHLMDLHEYLYDDNSAKFGTGYSDVYDNSILRENIIIKELLNKLRRNGDLENTIIAIGSDHGEAFSERGLEGHARRVFKETTEVPFILSFPFRIEPGLVLSQRTSNIDIWPTLLDLIGLPAMEGVDGISRKPEILAAARGEEFTERSDGPAFAHLDEHWGQREKKPSPTVSIAQGTYRYVTAPMLDQEHENDQLFDAGSDAAELRNIIEAQPEIAAKLKAEIDQYLTQTPPWGTDTETIEMDEMQLNQLRALGYKIP
ncbi:MAG: sulfatase [Proteobacteria bacterium]|nr:sulfatase [Pseudomonadota bacterium]